MRADPETIRRQRDEFFEKKNRPPMGSPFTTKVVGVSFAPGWPGTLHRLNEAWDQWEHKEEDMPAILVRTPDNEHDPNAIEVHVPAIGGGAHRIGHMTRPLAARLAGEIDSGIRWDASVVDVLIHPDHMEHPGITIRCRRMERTSA